MSTTDDKSGASDPQQPAADAGKVRVIEINISDILSGNVNFADVLRRSKPATPALRPIDIVSAALAAVQILKEYSESNPDVMERLLLGSWMSVEQRLEGHSPHAWRVDAMIMAEYFRHAGDWGAMRQCMISMGERLQSAQGEFHQKYEEALAKSRASLARQMSRE